MRSASRPTVRPVTSQDADRCAQLCQQALAELDQQRGGQLLARRETGLLAKALLRPGGLLRVAEDPRRMVLVGLLDDEIHALAAGRLQEVGESSLGMVDALYVAAPMRRAGLGKALVDALIAWFDGSSCRGVDAWALPGDRATKSIYESSGFKARLITMHRPLVEPG